jgi:hypothetical protein
MDEKPSTTQAPQGHPQSVPHQNLSSPPIEATPPAPEESPELDFKQKVVLLFGALITVNTQMLAQLGHATDQHTTLKDAQDQLEALKQNVASHHRNPPPAAS